MGRSYSLVVYADAITKTESDRDGNEVEREIRFMRGTPSSTWSRSMGSQRSTTPAGSEILALKWIEQSGKFFAEKSAVVRSGGNRVTTR